MPSTSSQLSFFASRVHCARIARPDGVRGRPPAATTRVAAHLLRWRGPRLPRRRPRPPASNDSARGGTCGPCLARWHMRRPPPATASAAAHAAPASSDSVRGGACGPALREGTCGPRILRPRSRPPPPASACSPARRRWPPA